MRPGMSPDRSREGGDTAMTPLVDRIANAVLYEGYLLYPYRPSVKNRRRWTFGGLFPRSYSEANLGTDPWMSQTECLVQADEGARLSVRVRFLQLQVRRVEREGAIPTDPGGPSDWQEAVEREVDVVDYHLTALVESPRTIAFGFPRHLERDPVPDADGTVIREQEPIAGTVELSAHRVDAGLCKVTLKVSNSTPIEQADRIGRDEAQLQAIVSTHAILRVRDGAFVSSIDPPEKWSEFAAGCLNIGAWPVLVGEPGDRHTMLSAPMILDDYPQIAPESPGDLFDSTEIDEILTLRILTLTDDEKQAMADVDERARALLERTESIAREQLMGLHGTIRGLRTV